MSLLERHPEESLLANRRLQGILGVVLLALLSVPFVTTDSLTGLILTGLVFVMLGVSWNLLAGYAGQISLGHAAFFGMGAFIAAWLTTPTAAGFPASIQLPILVAVVLGGVAAALISLVLGPILFRLSGHYFAIGTLALAAVIELVMLDQRSLTGGSTGYYVQGDLGLNEFVTHGDVMFLLTLVATILTIAVTYRIVSGAGGLGMKAIHDDEEAASSLGVNPLKYKMYAFVVSSFFAGLAGGLYGHYTLYINPQSTLAVTWTIDSLVIVILGGMGTFAGPVLGAGLFLLLDTGLAAIVGSVATTVEGALIILFIIYLPQGLYGLAQDYLVTDVDAGGADPHAADATPDGDPDVVTDED
ncbi:branched-chain amino acid ABC transporter permease [Haloarcula laminariae]|uniref:branched-chain amino acid ABC transporter permease n=1 Tax=Haloarcula laminariae TaxID=2961577 RepID=UPI0021C62753|nr:branched-chain amino acid ABC transporter permease [Halomicroarcula laminariae]